MRTPTLNRAGLPKSVETAQRWAVEGPQSIKKRRSASTGSRWSTVTSSAEELKIDEARGRVPGSRKATWSFASEPHATTGCSGA